MFTHFITVNKKEKEEESDDDMEKDAETVSAEVSLKDSLTSSQLLRRTSLVEEFRCPISHQIMRDPVFTSDGETYEREEIERWLQKNQVR